MTDVVPKRDANDVRISLAALGKQRKYLRDELAKVNNALLDAIGEADTHGIPETEIAKLARVARSTVRNKLGKD